MGVGPREKTDEEQLLDSPGFTKDNDPRMFFKLFILFKKLSIVFVVVCILIIKFS